MQREVSRMNLRSANSLSKRIPTKLLLIVTALLLAMNLGFFAGRALGQGGDIGSGVGPHPMLACRLVQTAHVPPPIGAAYGTIRILDLDVINGQVTPGTTPQTSCNEPAEQYIRVFIDHEANAHP